MASPVAGAAKSSGRFHRAHGAVLREPASPERRCGGAADFSTAPRPTSARRGRRIPGTKRGMRGRARRPSPGFAPPAGATNADGVNGADCDHAGPTGSATQAHAASGAAERDRDERVPRSDFTRISTLRLPSVRPRRRLARPRPGRDRLAGDLEDHVAGLEAVLGGNAVGSTSVTTTPSLPLPATCRREQATGRAAASSLPRVGACRSASARGFALRSAIRRASALTVFSLPLREHVELDVGAGRHAADLAASSRASFTPCRRPR